MYKLKNKTYAEAGYYLEGKKAKGFSAPTELGPFKERKLSILNLKVNDKFICFDNIKWVNPGIHSYSDAKKFIINKRYTNDDQIAIMLNKDDSEQDALAFNKMQEWRNWAAIVAKEIMENVNND